MLCNSPFFPFVLQFLQKWRGITKRQGELGHHRGYILMSPEQVRVTRRSKQKPAISRNHSHVARVTKWLSNLKQVFWTGTCIKSTLKLKQLRLGKQVCKLITSTGIRTKLVFKFQLWLLFQLRQLSLANEEMLTQILTKPLDEIIYVTSSTKKGKGRQERVVSIVNGKGEVCALKPLLIDDF